jgi:hypothetical protein
VSAKYCATLTIPDKNKLLKDATRGIYQDKFKQIVDLLNGLDSHFTMENIVAFNTLKDELQKYLTPYGLKNVFYILEFDQGGNPYTPSMSGGTINLIENPED